MPAGVDCVVLRGRALGRTEVWIDGKPVLDTQGCGNFGREIPLAASRGIFSYDALAGHPDGDLSLRPMVQRKSWTLCFRFKSRAHLLRGYCRAAGAEKEEIQKEVCSVRRLFPRADSGGLTGWSWMRRAAGSGRSMRTQC